MIKVIEEICSIHIFICDLKTKTIRIEKKNPVEND